MCSVALPSAVAQEPVRIGEGVWQGVLDIDNVIVGSLQGVSYRATLDLEGDFTAEVVNETTENDGPLIGVPGVDGRIESGAWQVAGDAELFTEDPAFGSGTVDWSMTGEGKVVDSATGANLPVNQSFTAALDGSVTTTDGIAVVVASFGSSSFPVPDSTDPIVFAMELKASDCSESYGSVALDLSQVDLPGARLIHEGSWFAYVNQDLNRLTMDQWSEDMKSASLSQVPSRPGLPDVAAMATALVNEFNDWIDDYYDGGASFSDTADLLNDAALFLVRLRNLTDCELEFFTDDELNTFESLAKWSLINIGKGLLQSGQSTARIHQLYMFALNLGALTRGGTDTLIAELQEDFRNAAEEKLREVNSFDPERLASSEEDLAIVSLGSLFGLSVEVDGKQVLLRDLHMDAINVLALRASEAAAEQRQANNETDEGE